MIEIDGSQGEGGGQIVRSSLTLSAITGKPFRISNIRAGRKKPGLKNQHVLAVSALQRICNAYAEGDSLGSSGLTFEPNAVCGGTFNFRVGTAGSTSLVAQTLIPVLLFADAPSTVTLEGGTHNPMAPTFDFIQRSYLPQLEKFGPSVSAQIHRPGFYPAGGGKIELNITPCRQFLGHDLLERGLEQSKKIVATVSKLPTDIGRREIDTILRKSQWRKNCGQVVSVEDPRGPGNVVMIEIAYENVTAIFTGFGQQGVKAERIASAVYRDAKKFIESGVPVEEYLADQLMLPMGLAASQGHTSSFLSSELSGHSKTHLEVLKRFLDIKTDVTTGEDGNETVQIAPDKS